MPAQIPDDLVEMLKQRRVIPFIGAGFSASLGLPDWDQMLRQMSAELEPGSPTYDDIKECCNGDYLQIAEYFYLKSDRSIGPLRHHLSKLLQPSGSPTTSTAHVELVNLNAQQIYTTNYDELIELTFKSLNHPFAFVALPKHIANSGRSKTQVVKYHGDLRHDATLVLTESSYYSRLEFESPLDLKFRSDLLGKSVLFVGYSFRDINIRIIWFKLMEMMKDVPEQDRPSSFIVRFEKNEVLEDLYRAVGIKTIYLDEENELKGDLQRTAAVGKFMFDLSMRISEDSKMPGSDQSMYMSTGCLDEVRQLLKKLAPVGQGRLSLGLNLRLRANAPTLMKHAAARSVPDSMRSDVDEFLGSFSPRALGTEVVTWALQRFRENPAPGAAKLLRLALFDAGTREPVLEPDAVNWELFWRMPLQAADADAIIARADTELTMHREHTRDHALAYLVDVLKRIELEQIGASLSREVREKAGAVLADALTDYPSIGDLTPDPIGPPGVADVLKEIDAAEPPPGYFDDEDSDQR